MENILILGLLFSIATYHLCYRDMLEKMKKHGVPVDRKSWGMGFSKNIPAYFKMIRREEHGIDGNLLALILSTVAGSGCVLGYWMLIF